MIWSSVQFPKPVSLSGRQVGADEDAFARNGESDVGAAERCGKSPACRGNDPGVWQSLQPAMVTRYLPRATSSSAAEAAEAPRHSAAASAGNTEFSHIGSLPVRCRRGASRAHAKSQLTHDARNPSASNFVRRYRPSSGASTRVGRIRAVRSRVAGARQSGRFASAAAQATRAGSAASSGRSSSVKPVSSLQLSPTAPRRVQRPLVEHELRPAVGGRGERADDHLGARAILLEGDAVDDDAQRLALRQGGDAAEPVAGRVGIARARRIAAVAVGGEPLLGGEGVEALADDLRARRRRRAPPPDRPRARRSRRSAARSSRR